LGIEPIGVASPPILAEYATPNKTTVVIFLSFMLRLARIPRVIGSIIAVVAVFETHIEKNAVRQRRAIIILLKEPLRKLRERSHREILLSSLLSFMALAKRNPPKKRKMILLENGVNAVFAVDTPMSTVRPTPMKPVTNKGKLVSNQFDTTKVKIAKNFF
jgi:hypothetical protein